MKHLKLKPIREPVECFGLKFYPILVEDYETFAVCKSVLEIRMSTLPVRYMVKDYLSALISMDLDSASGNAPKAHFFERLLALLSVSLRIDIDAKEFFRKNLELESLNDSVTVKSITLKQEDTVSKISAFDFSTQVRPLLANLNGLSIPDESENSEILEAELEKSRLKQQGGQRLKHETEDLLASVAYLSHCTRDSLLKWTVRELEDRVRAIERDRRHLMYGQAELSGMVKFKDGNPAPSIFFDVLDVSAGTTKLSDLNLPGTSKI